MKTSRTFLYAVLVWANSNSALACAPGQWDYATYNVSGGCSISFSRMCGAAGWWLPWSYGTCGFSRSRGNCIEQVSCAGAGPGGVTCNVVSRICR